MSAKITNLPEPIYKPDLSAAFKIIDSVNGPGLPRCRSMGSMPTAVAVTRVRRPRKVSGLMIAALALLTILGVPRSDLERL
jgi:hypothetical protein